MIPTAVFAGALLVLLWRQQQAELFRSLEDTVRAVSMAVDREVETSIERLMVLSQQTSFRTGEWAEFQREGQRLVATSEDWVNVLVFDERGDPLVNVTSQPPFPRFDGAEALALERALANHRPVVSDLFLNPRGEHVVHVVVPVTANDGSTRVLAASLELSRFDRLLADESVRSEGLTGIFDQKLHYLARGRDSERYLGMAPGAPLLERLQDRAGGTGRFAVDESPEVYAAWTRSKLTGWTVAFGVPAGPVEASLRSSLVMLGEVWLIVVIATVLIALHLGRQLGRSVAAATDSAMALASGAPLPTFKANVSELDVLSEALGRAEQILRQESLRRASVERERESLLEREQQARREAEAAGRAKDEFLAMLGHELRNPLAPILFAVELSKSKQPTQTRELEIIERQAKHIEHLVNDLLDITRIVQGKIAIDTRIGEVHPIIAQAVELAAPLLESKQHVLHLAVPREGLVVEADETRLAQVVANLLTNAAKFTAAGGHIGVTADRQGDEIVIRVWDTGTGIPAELMPHIFDIFTQGQRSAEINQGLGLGLALVQTFVRLHHGTVGVASDGLGCGSEFSVRLPAASFEADQPSTSASASGSGGVVLAQTLRILVVDDNSDAANRLAALLRARGYDVTAAYDGRRALELARSLAPDVAIIDIGMPVIDGYQVARALRLEHPGMHLIAVTGYGQDHDRERSRAAGFDHHVIKPVAQEPLLAWLRERLGEVRARA